MRLLTPACCPCSLVEVVGQLGQGGFGVVHRARLRRGTANGRCVMVAVKVMKKGGGVPEAQAFIR